MFKTKIHTVALITCCTMSLFASDLDNCQSLKYSIRDSGDITSLKHYVEECDATPSNSMLETYFLNTFKEESPKLSSCLGEYLYLIKDEKEVGIKMLKMSSKMGDVKAKENLGAIYSFKENPDAEESELVKYFEMSKDKDSNIMILSQQSELPELKFLVKYRNDTIGCFKEIRMTLNKYEDLKMDFETELISQNLPTSDKWSEFRYNRIKNKVELFDKLTKKT